MIRPRYLPDSIVAQLVSVSAFLHSLDPNRTLISGDGVSRSLPAREPIAEIVDLLEAPRYRTGAGARRTRATGARAVNNDLFVFTHNLGELGFAEDVIQL